MAVCVPGMEPVAADEIGEAFIKANNVRTERGKVYFDFTGPGMDPGGLKCSDNVYRLYRRFCVCGHKSDLPAIAEAAAGIGFETDGGNRGRVIVSASVRGRHTYSRFEAAEWVAESLAASGRFIRGKKDGYDLAVRIDIADGICEISEKLTEPGMRFRGSFISAPGGIRPTVAHCLVRLGKPRRSDVFYDPFCGAGTVAFERSFYPCGKIFASDINADITEIARQNLGGAAVVFTRDALDTCMKSGSVSSVVTNMPWGAQVAVENIDGLYKGFLGELKRILDERGRAVILTEYGRFASVCGEAGMNCERLAGLSLHGRRPSVYGVSRARLD